MHFNNTYALMVIIIMVLWQLIHLGTPTYGYIKYMYTPMCINIYVH